MGLAVLFQAVYPTCLVNFMKTLSIVGLNFSIVGGSIFSGSVDESNFSSGAPDYKFERLGYTTTSILLNAGDLLILWAILFVVYCLFYAFEFVLYNYPYARSLAQHYRYNFINAGMNFTFLKLTFDISYSMMAVRTVVKLTSISIVQH